MTPNLFFISVISFLVICSHSIHATKAMQCRLPNADLFTDWVSITDRCHEKLKSHINEELNAAMTYLAMGAHFSKDTVNRPGFAELFYKSAAEEREHAIKIIDYLLMRGGLVKDIASTIRNPKPVDGVQTWESGLAALKSALVLEHSVTNKIRDIIVLCEDSFAQGKSENDYHLVDYLTSEFLTEQYKGQKELADKISTLGKMMKMEKNAELGEFLFDKKLLKGEI